MPVPNISDIDELNKKLLEYCAVYRNHKIPGKNLIVPPDLKRYDSLMKDGDAV